MEICKFCINWNENIYRYYMSTQSLYNSYELLLVRELTMGRKKQIWYMKVSFIRHLVQMQLAKMARVKLLKLALLKKTSLKRRQYIQRRLRLEWVIENIKLIDNPWKTTGNSGLSALTSDHISWHILLGNFSHLRT
jgi:hypothetical protein